MVRLEMQIPAERVSVFRIWAWDRVYSGRYLGTRLQEHDWTKRRRLAGIDSDLRDWELQEPWKSELEKSWERVFDQLPPRKNGRGQPGGQEAVVEVLRRSDVEQVTEFLMTYGSYAEYIAGIKARVAAGRL